VVAIRRSAYMLSLKGGCHKTVYFHEGTKILGKSLCEVGFLYSARPLPKSFKNTCQLTNTLAYYQPLWWRRKKVFFYNIETRRRFVMDLSATGKPTGWTRGRRVQPRVWEAAEAGCDGSRRRATAECRITSPTTSASTFRRTTWRFRERRSIRLRQTH
jgi:hypothetical protein